MFLVNRFIRARRPSVFHSNQVKLQQQIKFLRNQFLQGCDLPLSDVLSKSVIMQALAAIDSCWKQRIYSPMVTLWVFLGQVLSADHSCRSAVARLIADRVAPWPVFFGNRSLLPSPKTSAREVLLNHGMWNGARIGQQRRFQLAMERTKRLHVRRIDCVDA